jgi:hypothetical protein
LVDLAAALWGPAWPAVVCGLMALLAYLIWTRRAGPTHLATILFLGIALLAYLVLPPDWMHEYRFASPVFPLALLLVALLARDAARTLAPARPARGHALLAVTRVGWLAGTTALVYLPRSERYSQHTDVSFQGMAALRAQFERYARRLGVRGGSLLLADVGEPLYSSSLRVYDLGGLTDPTIARTLDRDQPAFYDYVFERARPTFIHTNGVWVYLARLDDDPRFRRDYLPIVERPEPPGRAGLRPRLGGDYVRRDAVPSPDALKQMRR